jgi:hypothetical protein
LVCRIAVRVALELDGAVGARGEAFDEALELFGSDVACRDRTLIDDRDLVEGRADGIRRDSDEDSAVGATFNWAAAMVEEELARQNRGEIDPRRCRPVHDM